MFYVVSRTFDVLSQPCISGGGTLRLCVMLNSAEDLRDRRKNHRKISQKQGELFDWIFNLQLAIKQTGIFSLPLVRPSRILLPLTLPIHLYNEILPTHERSFLEVARLHPRVASGSIKGLHYLHLHAESSRSSRGVS